MVMNQDRLTARAEAVKSARTGLRPPTHRGAVPDGRHGYEPGRQERCEFKIVQLDFGLARYGIGRGPEIQFKFRAYPRGPVHAPPTTATLHDEPSALLLGIASEIFGKLYTGNSDHKFRGIQKCADILRMIDSERSEERRVGKECVSTCISR